MLRLVRWARSRRGDVAAALLVCLFAGPLVLPHADPVGDLACSAPAAFHDADAHRVGAVPQGHDDHAQHCFTCHIARSFSCLLRAAGHPDRSAGQLERLRPADGTARASVAWALVPGRAPPA